MERLNEVLLARLMALRIGSEGSVLTFETRLARENGWSAAYARRVMTEYRRFLYLAITAPADAPVTPSEAVDQAWHLHLAYSRDYWEGLCGDLIGRPLHHGPTIGGARETQRFHQQYDATIHRYTALFGAPPRDIWPAAAERFSVQMRWVDTRRHIILPRLPVMMTAAALGVSLLAACTGMRTGPEIGFLIVALPLVALVILSVRAKAKRDKTDGGCSGGGCGTSDGSDCGDSGSGCGGGCGGD